MISSQSANAIVLWTFIAVLNHVTDAQKIAPTCLTPHNKMGRCVNIKECNELLWLVLNKKHDPKAITFLRDSQCGYDGSSPKVCCKSHRQLQAKPIPQETEECGTNEIISQKIIGGEGAQAGDYPWMASLGYRKNKNSKPEWYCGGTLISRKYVITAAHCVTGIAPWELYLVRLGDVNLNDTIEDNATPLNVFIESTVVHNRHSVSPVVNDIALVRLKETVQITPFIKPICLPVQQEFHTNILENTNGYVAGWGRTTLFGPFSPSLQELKMPILSIEVCKKAYKGRPGSHIDNKNLCAGYLNGEKDSCQGDSGGPLMWLNESNSRYHIVGIVSYGFKCAERGFPGVYTRVSEYIDWISMNMH